MAEVSTRKLEQLRLAARLWRILGSPSDLPAVVKYIDDQEEHHRTRTFQDEYRALLTKYGVEFDERYLWDRQIGRALGPSK